MEPRERNRLRALQDRFLASPKAKVFESEFGRNATIDGPGSPTISQVKAMLYPAWEGYFKRTTGD